MATERPDILLSRYPLDRETLAAARARLGSDAEPLAVSTLGGASQAVHRLRALRAGCVAVHADDAIGRSMLPMMRCLAALVPARRRVWLDGERVVRFSRFGVPRDAVRLLVWSLGGLLRLPSWSMTIVKLAKAAPVAPDAADIRSVVFIKPTLWPGRPAGGAASHTAGLLRGFRDAGAKVRFVSAERMPDGVGAGIEIDTLAPPACYTLPRELNQLRHGARIAVALTGYGPPANTLIYERLTLGNVAGVVLSRHWGVPLVVEYNGSESWIAAHWGRKPLFEGLMRRAEAACLSHAHLIVAVSAPLRDELVRRGVAPERVLCVPNGVDLAGFDPARFDGAAILAWRRRVGIADDALVIGFAGTFGPWHGTEVLADALTRLIAETGGTIGGRALHTLFIGDGPGLGAVREIFAAPSLAGHASFTGMLPPHEVAAALAAADILTAPQVANPDGSAFFGSPTKLFEYMAMGRPVVASRLGQIADILVASPSVGGLPESWPDGAPAILCPPGNAALLADALRAFADHDAWRDAAGRAGRALALAHHGWDARARTILDSAAAMSDRRGCGAP